MNISILLMHSGCLGNTINTFPISEHCSFYFWTTQRRVNKDVLMSSSCIQLLKISRDQLGKQPMQKEYIVTGSDEHAAYLPEYFQSTILHAAHFQRVVQPLKVRYSSCIDASDTTRSLQ